LKGPERASPGGGAEIGKDRKKPVLFNAVLAEADASSHHPRSSFSAQIAHQSFPCDVEVN
jgi:hypothetical protein